MGDAFMTVRLAWASRIIDSIAAVPAVVWRVALWIFVVLLIVASTYRYAEKVHKVSRDGTLTKSAFLRWRDQIQGLERGDDIYHKYNYPNPPIQALILWPLTELDRFPGAMVWFFLKVVMAIVAIIWSIRICESPGSVIPLWAKTVAIIFSLHPILGDLSHGNVNIFIAFLVLGSLEAFRRRWDYSAGLVLSLAIACKVTPALFLPYFVWKRAWKTVAACLVGCGIWLFVVPGAILGWQQNNTLLTSWFDTMVRPFIIDGKVTSEHSNQSIPGLTFRLLTNEPSVIGYDEEDHKPLGLEFHNITDIGASGARWVIRGFQAAFVVCIVVLCWTPVNGVSGVRSGLRIGAEFSLVLIGMLLFSERTWKHHGVVLILPLLLISMAVACSPLWSWFRAFLISMFCLGLLLTIGPSLLNAEWQDLSLTYGSHTVMFLMMFAASGVILFNENRLANRTTNIA